MEIRSLILVMASVSAFSAAAFLTQTLLSEMKRVAIREKTQGGFIQQSWLVAILLRHGIVCLKPVASLLLKLKRIGAFVEDIRSLLQAKSYTTTQINITSLLSALMILVFCASSLIASSPFVGVLASGASLAFMLVLLKQSQEAKGEALRASIPEALRSMSMCSHAGYSLQQTFEQIAQEASEPLASLFSHAVHDLKTGKTVSEALNALKENAASDELAFISVALDVQHRTGGSLRQVLDTARESVESELELKRALKVQTAQAKLSARIVSIMPFVLIVAFSFLSPGFFDPFFRSLEGMALLGLAAVMQVSGILLVRRLLNVDVSEKGRS